MYIAPNTVIKLLTNVRLDNTYEHTLYFVDKTAQLAFFNSKVLHTFLNQTYQRITRNIVRLNFNADDLYNCNYMMFQNTSYGNKWFYAFITSIDYVNNATCDVKFEIDVVQTWLFETQINNSFVVRQHTPTDVIGENLVPDNLELGEYRFQNLGIDSHFDRWQICVAATFDKQFNDAAGGLVSGIFSGLCFNTFYSASAAADFLKEATEKNLANGVVSIFMIPEDFANPGPGSSNPSYYNTTFQKAYTDINGYVPNNKKLFTYPYQTLYVTNNEGIAANFPYEYFEGNEGCQFRVACTMSCSPQASCVPLNYKGVYLNYNEKIDVGNFPQCAYAIDSYRAWIAQNQARLVMTGVRHVVNAGKAMTGVAYAGEGIKGAATGETGSAISKAAFGHIDAALGTMDTLAQMYDKSTMPMQATSGGGSSINIAMGCKGFQYYRAYIRKEFAMIIDNYWDVYGYPIHRVMLPNRAARPHWTYLKLMNANLTGNVPSDDMAYIRSLYQKGMTWWRNGNEVGNYSFDNRAPQGGN